MKEISTTIKNVKKNAPRPISNTIELTAISRTIESAAKEVSIVPMVPVSKHPKFLRKQPIEELQEPLHEPAKRTPRIYIKTKDARLKAIQIPVTISGV